MVNVNAFINNNVLRQFPIVKCAKNSNNTGNEMNKRKTTTTGTPLLFSLPPTQDISDLLEPQPIQSANTKKEQEEEYYLSLLQSSISNKEKAKKNKSQQQKTSSASGQQQQQTGQQQQQQRITLNRFLNNKVKENPELRDLEFLLSIQMACKTISNLVNRCGLEQAYQQPDILSMSRQKQKQKKEKDKEKEKKNSNEKTMTNATTTTTTVSSSSSEITNTITSSSSSEQVIDNNNNVVNDPGVVIVESYPPKDGRFYSMKRLDSLCTNVLKSSLRYTGKCQTIVPAVIKPELGDVGTHQPGVLIASSFDSNYVAVLDPLDGSGNADAAICTGTVFGVYPIKKKKTDGDDAAGSNEDDDDEKNRKKKREIFFKLFRKQGDKERKERKRKEKEQKKQDKQKKKKDKQESSITTTDDYISSSKTDKDDADDDDDDYDGYDYDNFAYYEDYDEYADEYDDDDDDDEYYGDYDIDDLIESVLQPGKNMRAAGYCIYSSATVLVFTLGETDGGLVYSFTLDPQTKEFILTNTNLTIPKRGNVYSCNECNSIGWSTDIQNYIYKLKSGNNQSNKRYAHRYVGSMVGDIHRTLTYGGIFMYPSDNIQHPNGNLQLLYKSSPMAYIVKQAGGDSFSTYDDDNNNSNDVNGKNGHNKLPSLLDIKPNSVHHKVPCFLGSIDDINELKETIQQESLSMSMTEKDHQNEEEEGNGKEKKDENQDKKENDKDNDCDDVDT